MSSIKKLNKLENKELLKETPFNLLILRDGNLKRTACLCGYIQSGVNYTCPKCGNSKHYQEYYISFPFFYSKPKFDLKSDGFEFYQNEYYISIDKDKNYFGIKKVKNTIFSKSSLGYYEGNNYSQDGLFELILEKKEYFPKKDIKIIEMFNQVNCSFSHLSTILKNENLRNIFFDNSNNKKFISNALTSYYLKDSLKYHKNIQSYLSNYDVPKEFHDLFIKHFPINTDIFYYRYENGFHKSVGERKFVLPKNWDYVPEEIKNILNYYLDNEIIDIADYFKVGSINVKLLKEKDFLSKFLKRYLIHLKGRTFEILHAIYNSELTSNEITIENLDYKRFNQLKNLNKIREFTNKKEENINKFINTLNDNGVDGLEELSKSKGIKKK